MIDSKILAQFPLKRLKAVDGLLVTAHLWEESHEFHRERMRLHNLLQHGAGIVTGLEVIASDPADTTVYVRPGLAIDGNGEWIVIQEPVAYDCGAGTGMVYLVLTYTESRAEQQNNGGPLYIQAQFGLEAVPQLPQLPFIELARIRRTNKGAITDASMTDRPDANEIDQRFRKHSTAVDEQANSVVRMAVCTIGKTLQKHNDHGAMNLARAVKSSSFRVIVDVDVPVSDSLRDYNLVYLVGESGAGFTREQMNAVYAYLQGGGTVFMESCRRSSVKDAEAADVVFFELASSLGIQLAEIGPEQTLLSEPNVFGVLPPGFESEGSPRVLVGDGLIFSSFDYGCLWQGQRRGRPAQREEIRSAMEWGENLLAFAKKASAV